MSGTKTLQRRWPALPPHAAGLAVGLLGGSFNPPHAGHRHISEIALKRLGLDAVWWLVTPGNPLKARDDLAPLAERVAKAAAVAAHPRIQVTAVEADIGMTRTRDTLRYLKRRCPGVKFVWLMGADNLAAFHRWHAWEEIARLVPIAVVDRPGYTFTSVAGLAARRFAGHRVDEADAAILPRMKPPAWVLLHAPRLALSSTELRRNGER